MDTRQQGSILFGLLLSLLFDALSFFCAPLFLKGPDVRVALLIRLWIWQVFWIAPLYFWFSRKGERRTVRGLLIGASATLVVNLGLLAYIASIFKGGF